MGLCEAVIVLPTKTSTFASVCSHRAGTLNDQARTYRCETDFRLDPAAYDPPSTCYDREYLFQFSEMDPKIHRLAEMAVTQSNCPTGSSCPLNVQTEPY